MNTDQEIEQALAGLRFRISPERNERTITEATLVLQSTPKISTRARLIRRAAILLLPLGLFAAVFTYLQRPAFTLADVSDALAKQTWVHIKYDNGQEEWTDLADGRRFFKDYDGRAVYTDSKGLRLWFWADSSFITKDKVWAEDSQSTSKRRMSPWDEFVGTYEKAATQASLRRNVERHEDRLGAKAVVRFDCYFTDALNQSILVQQVWADPRTRLPVQQRRVLQLADRERQHRDAIVGSYDFPATGPSSIYDLGVRKDLPIYDADTKPTEDVEKIIAAAQAARDRFPKCYRLIAWSKREGGEVDQIFRDGERSASTRWFKSTSALKGYPPPGPAPSLKQVLDLIASGRMPVEEHVDDGKRAFTRITNIYNDPKRPPAEARVTESPHFPEDSNTPPGTHWPGIAASTRKIDPPADAPRGVIVVRDEAGDERWEHWIDPARDYINIREISQKKIGEEWKTEDVAILDQFRRLPGGQWFAAERRIEQYQSIVDGKPYIETQLLDLQPLHSSDILPGTFDGEKLLKNAKVETY